MNRFIIASLIPVLLVTSCSRQEPVSHEENIPLEKAIITTVTSETERSTAMDEYDFSVFGNVEITFTSVLYANAYGATGTYRMNGTHHYELRDGNWIAVNGTR